MGWLRVGSPLSIRNSEGAWPIVAVLTWNLSVSTSSAQRVQFVTLEGRCVKKKSAHFPNNHVCIKFSVQKTYFACSPLPTNRCPSLDIIEPESSQMKNLDGVPISPAARAFRSPVGHPCSAKCCFRASLSDISALKFLQVKVFLYTTNLVEVTSFRPNSCLQAERDKILQNFETRATRRTRKLNFWSLSVRCSAWQESNLRFWKSRKSTYISKFQARVSLKI